MFPFGAILSGDPMGSAQKATANKYALDKAEVDKEADAAFGRSLQALYQGIGQQQQAGPPQAFQPQQTPQVAPQAGPGAPQGAPAPQPQQPMAAQIPGAQPIAGPPGAPPQAGPAGPPQARPPAPAPKSPQGQPAPAPSSGPPGPQSDKGGLGQKGGGILTLQQIIPAVQKAVGPNADPAVFAAAVNKYIPLMNATAQEQWKGMQMELRQAQLQHQQALTDQGYERLDLQRQGLAQREQSLALRERRQVFNEKISNAKLEMLQLQVNQRFIDTNKRLDEAKKKNDLNALRAAEQALHNMVNERLQAFNVGLKQQGLQQDITELQAQSKEIFDAMHKAITEHAQAPILRQPADEVKERFPSYPGDSSQ
jgi:hypothetical protein